jgi:GGDEF domain-containing protein
MRFKVSSIIAVISIVLYVAALGTGIIRILAGINERRDIARREFNNLVSIASDAGNRGFMEEPFKETVRNTLHGSETLQAVIVTGPFGAGFKEERVGGLIIQDGDGLRFQSKFGYSPAPYSSPLRVNEPRNATIMAVSNDIDVPSVQTILVQSLLIVAVAILLSTVTLLIYAFRGKKPALVSDKMQETLRRSADLWSADQRSDAFETASSPEPDLKQEPIVEEPAPEVLVAEPPEPVSSADNGEDDTREKLDAELRRCSDAEQDLTLIFMELSPSAGAGIGDDALVYRTFSGRVRQFFTIRDLVVEKGDRSIAIILPGSSIEDGFDKARQFHDQMLTGFPELFPNKDDLRIGISARSGRILATDRLLLEASKALERAGLEPESPIVAFKSDPEKYKAFVQKQGKKARGV